MKTLTASLLLCAGLAVGAAAQAQPAQVAPNADAGTWSRNLDGFWVVKYQAPQTKTADQVRAELAQAKATGLYAFAEEDYPIIVNKGPSESRAQVQDELQQAQKVGIMESDEEAYPPTASSGMSSMH